MNKMTVVVGLVVLAAACGTAETAEVGTEGGGVEASLVNHVVWNGSGAGASSWSETSSWSFDVSENKQASGATNAWINYFSSEADPTSYQCETKTARCKCRVAGPCECPPIEWCRYTRYTYQYGWGAIPAKAFHAAGGRATIDVALRPGADFQAERCTVDEVAGTWDCTQGEGTTLKGTWTANGETKWSNSGSSTSRYGKYFYKYVGNSSSQSMDFAGTFLGAQVKGAGWSGKGVNVGIDRYEATRR